MTVAVNEKRTGDIQSVHRALDILEVVCRSGTLGVTEIAKELGLAVSTAHNIVRTLARRDYLLGEDGAIPTRSGNHGIDDASGPGLVLVDRDPTRAAAAERVHRARGDRHRAARP